MDRKINEVITVASKLINDIKNYQDNFSNENQFIKSALFNVKIISEPTKYNRTIVPGIIKFTFECEVSTEMLRQDYINLK